MKKQILNLGKALNKAEQKSINGGNSFYCALLECSACFKCVYNGGTSAHCEPDPTEMC